MAVDSERLSEDILFLACTRPAMMAGATIEAWFVIGLGTVTIFLIGGSIFYLICGGFVYAVCRLACRHDPNQFGLLAAWLATKARCRTRAYWGASSASPLPVHEPRTARELERPGGMT